MTLKTLNGDQAMAFGALTSGVKLVTSYPWSPSSGTVETLISLAKKHKIYSVKLKGKKKNHPNVLQVFDSSNTHY